MRLWIFVCYEHENTGLSAEHLGNFLILKNLAWYASRPFRLSAALPYVYENIVASDFNLVAILANARIHD